MSASDTSQAENQLKPQDEIGTETKDTNTEEASETAATK